MGIWPAPKLRAALRRARERGGPEPVIVMGESPYAEKGSLVRKQRDEAAMTLVDDDTHGYLVVRLREESDGTGRIEVRGHVRGQHRPAFKRTLERIIEHGLPPDD